MSKGRWALALSVTITLGACGGSDEPNSHADQGPVGYYSTVGFRGTSLLALMEFDGGLVYGFYQSDFTSSVVPEYAYAGFFSVQRHREDEAGKHHVGVEFNFDERRADSVELVLSDDRGGTVTGELTESATRTTAPFFAIASENSGLATARQTLPGSYRAQVRSTRGSARMNATVDQAGRLSAESTEGCKIEASLEPRPLGNLYDVKATIGPGCVVDADTFTGHALQAYAIPLVYVLLSSRSGQGVMLVLQPL